MVGILAAGICLIVAGIAKAQEASSEDLRVRLERLEQENQRLLKQYEQLHVVPTAAVPGSFPANAAADNPLAPGEVKKIVGAYLEEADQQKKAADDAAKAKAEEEGYRIGTDLKMSATWNNGVVIETPNKDFTMHFGGWVQYDNVFWDESPGLLVPPSTTRAGAKQGVASGPFLGGIGDLEDGTFFRRIRLDTEGTFWEKFEYKLHLALENMQYSTVGLEQYWIGINDTPVIGNIRIGHFKTPIGLEDGTTASSKALTFLESSSYAEAIQQSQARVAGLWLGNNYFDQRTTWSFAAFRQDLSSFTGTFFGDGQYGLQGRWTALPIWEDDGRCWMHVGVSGGWRDGTNNLANSPLHVFQLRSRPELRDGNPAGDPSGTQIVANANDNRMIDTGVIAAQQQWILGLEFAWVMGPLYLQAEYGYNWIDDATGVFATSAKLTPLPAAPQTYMFSGGYVQLSYTLTGENRSYDKRLGLLDSYYYGRQGLYNNAWFVRDDDGHINMNWGAWEIAARYSYVNLNDGEGLNRIQGGVMNGYTIGLNWYLSNNLKFQFNYVYNQRSDLPPGVIEGSTRGFGTRMQFMY
jgi:phosphate-selective porin OprO/OprP